jgi:hypothetical protein
MDIDGTTLAWVADDVPIGLVALCRLQCDQAGTSSFLKLSRKNDETVSPR